MRRIKNEPYVRVTFDELPTLIPTLKIKRIATNLKDSKAIIMANIYECLMDSDNKFPERKYTIFKVKEDMGVKKLQIGTPGGGYYGPYRRFKIQFRDQELIAGIGMNRFLNKVRTILCVSLQKGEDGKPHHSLQLGVDDYMSIEGKKCYFTHNGNIGLGELGSGKHAVLREEYIRPLYPEIIKEDGTYFLGQLPTNKLYYLNRRPMTNFIENLISYAIARDMYRDDEKRKAGLI